MLCPDCAHDNIEGMDNCEACGQSLVSFDTVGGEMERSISRHSVGVLCPPTPLTITATTSANSAIDAMSTNNVGCLLVTDEGGQLAGIFTERDVLNQLSSDTDRMCEPVEAFMTRTPITASQDDSIAYALHAMDLGGYRHLPIVDDQDRPTGVISVRDILRFLCVSFAELRTSS